MSNDTGHHETHETPIKTPKQLIIVVILAFVVPVVLLIMLANLVTFTSRESSGSDALTAEATAQRIAPVAGYEFVDANAPRVFQTGEQIYKQICSACHSAGVAGAPKVGDKAGWTNLIASGLNQMIAIAIKGQGGMPARGGNPALSDYEVARAVVFMANQSGGSFDEPSAPEREGSSNAAGDGQAAAPEAAPAAPVLASPTATVPALAQTSAAEGGAPAATAQINPAGEKLYKTTCFACHTAGLAGAPKFGDKAAWAPYIATGEDGMLKIVLSGKGAMPPKGGAMNASEDDLRAAVRFMVNAAQ